MRKTTSCILAAAVCTSMLLTACTSNTGEGTIPSDSVATATQTMGDLSYTIETMDLSGQNISTVYGSQLSGYLNHQYYFEGEPVSLTESNFYFIDTFTDFTQYAGYYYPATSEGFIDLAATIETTGGDDEINQFTTYGDFYVSYAEEMLESALIINKLAAQDGVTLSSETQAEIDAVMANIETNGSVPAGITVDEYLSIYYGEGTTAESFRQTVERYYIADVYTQAWVDSYEYDDSEIMVPNIRYALFADTEGTPESLAAAQEAADSLMNECSSLDSFAVAGALAYTNGTCYQYGEIPTPNDGSIDPVFTEWAWDDSREEGDIEVIYSENFGYFVVGYVGLTEVDEASKTQIAVAALSHEISDAIDNNTYNFYTDTAFEPAPTVPEIDYGDMTLPTETTAVASEGQVGGMTGSKAFDVLLIVFAAIGGVAIIGLAVVGVMSISKNNKQDSSKKSTKENSNGDN